MNNRIYIDLLALTDETRQLLNRLLVRKRRNGLRLAKREAYWVGLQRVSLSHDIIIREKLPGIWHFDIVDEHECGKGKFGSAHVILGVLQQNQQSAASLELPVLKSKRVYKKQKNAALDESRLMQRCPHLFARAVIPGLPSYISMRKFPGLMLNNALNEERRNQPFSHAQRYKLTIGLLRALKKQIHENMIIHRDIKPDNIFYNPEDGEINIFDLGISCLIGDTRDRRSRGNATFSAPEEFTSVRTGRPVTLSEFRTFDAMETRSTVKADIYSMARVIGLVWRDADPIFFVENADHALLMKRRIHDNWRANFILFQGLNSLAVKEKENISRFLSFMTAINPDDRPDIDRCIEYFERLYLNYKLNKSPEDIRDDISNAHYLALHLRHKLDQHEKIHDLRLRISAAADELGVDLSVSIGEFVRTLKSKWNLDCVTLSDEIDQCWKSGLIDAHVNLYELNQALSASHSRQVLFSLIRSAIHVLPDNPNSVMEMVDTLEIKALSGIRSRQALLEKVDEIELEFNYNIQSLLHLSEYMSVNGRDGDAEELSRMISSLRRSRVNLDAICQSSRHIQNKIYKMSEREDPHSNAHFNI